MNNYIIFFMGTIVAILATVGVFTAKNSIEEHNQLSGTDPRLPGKTNAN